MSVKLFYSAFAPGICSCCQTYGSKVHKVSVLCRRCWDRHRHKIYRQNKLRGVVLENVITAEKIGCD